MECHVQGCSKKVFKVVGLASNTAFGKEILDAPLCLEHWKSLQGLASASISTKTSTKDNNES